MSGHLAAFVYFQASQMLMSSDMGIVSSLALVAGEESHAVPTITSSSWCCSSGHTGIRLNSGNRWSLTTKNEL